MKTALRLLLTLLLCVILCLCFSSAACAETVASGECGDNLTWTLDDEGLLTISGTGEMYDYSYVDYNDGAYFITTAPWGASPTSVLIEDDVTSIGTNAFTGCSSLTSITISESVTSIGDEAFQYCGSLTSIALPDSLTSIGDRAFWFCSSLMRIAIPESVTSIGNGAFEFCSSLTSIVLPDSITSIGSGVFCYCGSLTEIVIPDGLTSIDHMAFAGCGSLTGITIPDGLTSIGDEAFAGCGSLKSITIPDSVTSIEYYAFSSCYNLSKVAFLLCDESVNISIDAEVFNGHTPTVYCYMFTAVDGWASSNGFPVVYLDEIDLEDIRTLTLPTDFRLALGDSRQIVPCVFPDFSEPVTWSSSDPSVVRVTDGVVTAMDTGSATVTATVGTTSASMRIEVYIPATGFELNVSEAWVLAKSPIQLSVASFTPANAEAKLTWRSSESTYATVDENGLVTTYIPGDVTITATSERGIQRRCLLHLCYPVTAVELTAPYDRLIIGNDMQLTANVTMRTQSCVNHLVTFTSSDTSVATVDSETGLVHGVAPGTVTITATSASNKSDSVDITVVDHCDGHVPVVDEAVAPSWTESGLTEGSHCAVCGEVLTPQEIIPALNTLRVPRFPAGLTAIEAEAFENTLFQAVLIPGTVTSIGSRAFADCKDLLYVFIPAGVTLAEDAFDGCPNVFIDFEVPDTTE